MIQIRRYRPDDLDALYRICLETGDGGQDATALFDDPRLLGHVYAAQYATFEPSLAFVAVDDDGVGGYVLGARDTATFEARLEADWWPALRAKYPEPPAGVALTRDQQVARNIHQPFSTPAALTDDYPSHLHVDLLPRLQGRGVGADLMRTLLDALREQASRGVHLHVRRENGRAIAFYRHLGFAELQSDAEGFVFGMRLC